MSPLNVYSRVGVVGLNFQLALGLFGHEVGTDERVKIPIQNAVHIADTELGAVVLDHAIGLHDVGTNLAAEGNVQLGFIQAFGSSRRFCISNS